MRRHEDAKELVFPRFDQISAMSRDLTRCLPAYQIEIWCWILVRLARKAQSPWGERLEWAIHELRQGLPDPSDPTRWHGPVDWDAAYHLGFTGPIMSPQSAVILSVLMAAMERDLGPDHVDIQPMHRYRCGLRDRITMLLEKGLDATPDA